MTCDEFAGETPATTEIQPIPPVASVVKPQKADRKLRFSREFKNPPEPEERPSDPCNPWSGLGRIC